jgi:hypothetical protein
MIKKKNRTVLVEVSVSKEEREGYVTDKWASFEKDLTQSSSLIFH